VLKYEDLLRWPEFYFKKILKRDLRLNYTHERVLKVVAACNFDNLRAQEIGQGFNEGHGQTFFNNGKSVWRDVLSESQEKRIRRRHSKVMKALGYI
jgi:hypothetical protein